MQTLRKKTSPLKYKNETTRFLGEGVSFKAKLIGILEVSEARGDRMCQEALSDLKMAIRAAGEHKQRITISIAIDGLRLRDEKTGDSLYHHPVHKISFIAQDMTDSRAFGYIFGSPDTGHRFFGIKTDKAASQVVIAMRDLFQVVFALKKKEIEMAKQHIDKHRYGSSPIYSESASTAKANASEAGRNMSGDKGSTSETKSGNTVVANLVDLELELNSLQQGLHQMERITPSDPFGSKDDPFGDSFTNYTKPILPPPPSSGRERSSRTSESSSVFSPKTPQTGDSETSSTKKDLFSQELNMFNDEIPGNDWFASGGKSLLVTEQNKEEQHEKAKKEILSQFDIFTDLDPLGTGKSKPYIDKKHFFQELKNPPKKVLNDLVSQTQQDLNIVLKNFSQNSTKNDLSDPFGEDPFITQDPFAESEFLKQDPFETEFADFKNQPARMNDFGFERKSPNFPLVKQGTFAAKFERFDSNEDSKLLQSHESHSFEIGDGESAPEPPPRPEATLMQIKPPPLPPKKQVNDLAVKPPPRPPPSEEYKDDLKPPNVEKKLLEKSPPLPAPARKSKFESQFEDNYLTPITFPEHVEPPILPPPKSTKKNITQVTVASFLESKPSLVTSTADTSMESLNITLSQLTLSGLNELSSKLNIPPAQLSNMTLVQLTNYLSSVLNQAPKTDEPPFKADFASNFDTFQPSTTSQTFDRYAVFRELMNEEIRQTKIDTEPEEIQIENKLPEENDKYAALRQIVDSELKTDKNEEENLEENVQEENSITKENKVNIEEKPLNCNLIEYNVEFKEEKVPPKSPTLEKSPTVEVMQTNARLNSGSLSDVISGSSPEVDNTFEGKKDPDVTGESWAIFDQTVDAEAVKEKQAIQSEEGVSPWSSDSKEFGNGSPTDWRSGDSDRWTKRRERREADWWEQSEPEAKYYPNRRSTDSYEDDYHECYEKPRRRKQAAYIHSSQGGHSSSSRDVSPWEEEPRRGKEQRVAWMKHSKQHSLEKHRDRRHTDSWDDEEDNDYEDEQIKRFHRYNKREFETEMYENYPEDRRGRRRREGERDRWCCSDWDQLIHEKMGRYGNRWVGDGHPTIRRDRHYTRESQESPWEDDYSNEADEIPSQNYLAAKKNWKRPSSASEMDRKTGEIKSRYHLGTGGSDGERDKRYKPARRSRSRDSQYSESYRYKPETNIPLRGSLHRNKPHEYEASRKPEIKTDPKKSITLINRKKLKDHKLDEGSVNTFPRKSGSHSNSFFENDFTSTEESPAKYNFDNEFETSEAESPTLVNKTFKEANQAQNDDFNRNGYRAKSLKDIKTTHLQSKSLFEDDFSPSEKQEPEETSISSIKEEIDPDEDSFDTTFETVHHKKKIHKRHNTRNDINIKKSESVNIFTRENDPFDDDFFCESMSEKGVQKSDKTADLKWTDDFEDFGRHQK